jgi:hypothetical protein
MGIADGAGVNAEWFGGSSCICIILIIIVLFCICGRGFI